MNMTSLLWRHVYIGRRTQSVSAVFYALFYHLPSVKRHCELTYEYQKNECVQQWNLFKCQTSNFYFSTYCPYLFEHLLIHAGQTVWETRLLRSLDQSLKQHIGQARSFFSNNTFSPTSKLHQTCIAGLVKHLSPYTGRISEWVAFGQRLFAQRKWIRERCSLRDAFSGSVAIFIVDIWRHSDVIVIKLTAVIQN